MAKNTKKPAENVKKSHNVEENDEKTKYLQQYVTNEIMIGVLRENPTFLFETEETQKKMVEEFGEKYIKNFKKFLEYKTIIDFLRDYE